MSDAVSSQTDLEQLQQELERRLTIIEADELEDPVHSALSARSLWVFLLIAAALVVLPLLAVTL